jgi:hypothetical protein
VKRHIGLTIREQFTLRILVADGTSAAEHREAADAGIILRGHMHTSTRSGDRADRRIHIINTDIPEPAWPHTRRRCAGWPRHHSANERAAG